MVAACHQDLDDALDGVDAVMMLRLQRERMEEGLVPSLEQYFHDYGLERATDCAAPRRMRSCCIRAR